MDVYLVPVGASRYELYCEVPDEPPDAPEERPGLFGRLGQRFSELLAEAERERRHGTPDRSERGWFDRMKARTMRWVAESIAEQRLLWHLRRQDSARLLHPDDLASGAADGLLRQQLRRDFDRHRFWLVIDSLGFVGSGLLFLVPGPNVVAYYFAFRMIGHYFSLRGARQGMVAVAWTREPSQLLGELRRVVRLEEEARRRRVHEIADALGLEHFAKFFERTAVPE